MKRIGMVVICISIMCALFTGCAGKSKDAIVIGASRSITGANAVFEQMAFGPIYKMWIDEVNAAGGIFVKEYGKKLPIKTVIYDDQSDLGLMAKNLEKLITEDKVDMLLPPIGTQALFAAAPIFNKYKYVLMGAEGGASKIKEVISQYPYFFSLLSFSDHNQIPVMADLLEKLGVKKVGIIFISDLHGIEYSQVAVPQLAMKGIDVAVTRSVPVGVKDLKPILQEMKRANVDAFLSFAYPAENMLATGQSIEIGFNPKVFLTGPGSNFTFFSQAFGPAANGIMGFGAWNAKVNAEHKAFAEKLTKLYDGQIDWWGANLYYAGLQFLQQAIEKAGTLNQEKIREVFATEKLPTLLGPTWFDDKHLLAVECHSGELGQWQNGVFEVIGPEDKATAKAIYPKPVWPAPQPK